jgi:DDE superfamily endonuclease
MCFPLALVARIDSNSVRPSNPRELFNLRHASARNVIERIFGILKRRFRILLLAPEYDMDIQARIPPALCALHNFIRQYDPSDIEDYVDMTEFLHIREDDPGLGVGDLATHALTAAERNRADAKRDQIAQAMWDSYQDIVRNRGEPLETLED